MASEPVLLGTVPGGKGDPMTVYLLPDGGVTLNAGGIVFPVLAGELEGLAEILQRAAMPGQAAPVSLTLYGCCEHCEDGDNDRPCGIHHRDTCMVRDCEPGHKAHTAVVTEASGE